MRLAWTILVAAVIALLVVPGVVAAVALAGSPQSQAKPGGTTNATGQVFKVNPVQSSGIQIHNLEDLPRMIDPAHMRQKEEWWLDLRSLISHLT